MPLIYSVLTFFLTLGLLALELFIPSGGLLGIAAAAALITSVILGFMHSLGAGTVITILSAIGIPALISVGLRVWPRTAIGRKMLNIDPAENVDPVEDLRAERQQWIGKTGFAITDMLPSGLIEIDGRRLDAVSNGVAIDRGEPVEVCDFIAGRLQVKRRSVAVDTLSVADTAATVESELSNVPPAVASGPTKVPSLLETPFDELDNPR